MIEIAKSAARKVLRSGKIRDFCRKHILSDEISALERRAALLAGEKDLQSGLIAAMQAGFSYAQAGEDKILAFIALQFCDLKPDEINYFEIGGHDPSACNNTFALYINGRRGVVVEPNPFWVRRFKELRAEDTVLEAGISLNGLEEELDYFMFSEEDPELSSMNTFSRERADLVAKCRGLSYRAVKRRTLFFDALAEKHFGSLGRELHFVSCDIEGCEVEFIKSIRLVKVRPWIFCLESDQTDFDPDHEHPLIREMAKHDYICVANSSINLFFVAKEHFTTGNFVWMEKNEAAGSKTAGAANA